MNSFQSVYCFMFVCYRLVEEFMLLANMAVANRIYKSFPEISTLRRHPPPQTRQVDDLVATCSGLGIRIDPSTAGTLQVQHIIV